ncbi:hypothetical protein BLOT_013513 [Blomia tropicalis]|nr:hypothetical protein BLOT_013513 [Blomia tropicalis]
MLILTGSVLATSNLINQLIDAVLPTTECGANEFRCRSLERLCIPLSAVSDGVSDCPDGSDECSNHETQFRCRCGRPICIDKTKWMDGKIDCEDGSDERSIDSLSSEKCMENELSSGTFIPQSASNTIELNSATTNSPKVSTKDENQSTTTTTTTESTIEQIENVRHNHQNSRPSWRCSNQTFSFDDRALTLLTGLYRRTSDSSLTSGFMFVCAKYLHSNSQCQQVPIDIMLERSEQSADNDHSTMSVDLFDEKIVVKIYSQPDTLASDRIRQVLNNQSSNRKLMRTHTVGNLNEHFPTIQPEAISESLKTYFSNGNIPTYDPTKIDLIVPTIVSSTSTSSTNEINSIRNTSTIFGFLDFTTIVNNTLLIFTPKSQAELNSNSKSERIVPTRSAIFQDLVPSTESMIVSDELSSSIIEASPSSLDTMTTLTSEMVEERPTLSNIMEQGEKSLSIMTSGVTITSGFILPSFGSDHVVNNPSIMATPIISSSSSSATRTPEDMDATDEIDELASLQLPSSLPSPSLSSKMMVKPTKTIKTYYTTYTYFTTFKDDHTEFVHSRKEIVTNVDQIFAIQPSISSSSSTTMSMIEKQSSTSTITSNNKNNNLESTITSSIEPIVTDIGSGSSLPATISGASLSSTAPTAATAPLNKSYLGKLLSGIAVPITHYTTYTYYTTFFKDQSSSEIVSRTKVISNIVTGTINLNPTIQKRSTNYDDDIMADGAEQLPIVITPVTEYATSTYLTTFFVPGEGSTVITNTQIKSKVYLPDFSEIALKPTHSTQQSQQTSTTATSTSTGRLTKIRNQSSTGTRLINGLPILDNGDIELLVTGSTLKTVAPYSSKAERIHEREDEVSETIVQPTIQPTRKRVVITRTKTLPNAHSLNGLPRKSTIIIRGTPGSQHHHSISEDQFGSDDPHNHYRTGRIHPKVSATPVTYYTTYTYYTTELVNGVPVVRSNQHLFSTVIEGKVLPTRVLPTIHRLSKRTVSALDSSIDNDMNDDNNNNNRPQSEEVADNKIEVSDNNQKLSSSISSTQSSIGVISEQTNKNGLQTLVTQIIGTMINGLYAQFAVTKTLEPMDKLSKMSTTLIPEPIETMIESNNLVEDVATTTESGLEIIMSPELTTESALSMETETTTTTSLATIETTTMEQSELSIIDVSKNHSKIVDYRTGLISSVIDTITSDNVLIRITKEIFGTYIGGIYAHLGKTRSDTIDFTIPHPISTPSFSVPLTSILSSMTVSDSLSSSVLATPTIESSSTSTPTSVVWSSLPGLSTISFSTETINQTILVHTTEYYTTEINGFTAHYSRSTSNEFRMIEPTETLTTSRPSVHFPTPVRFLFNLKSSSMVSAINHNHNHNQNNNLDNRPSFRSNGSGSRKYKEIFDDDDERDYYDEIQPAAGGHMPRSRIIREKDSQPIVEYEYDLDYADNLDPMNPKAPEPLQPIRPSSTFTPIDYSSSSSTYRPQPVRSNSYGYNTRRGAGFGQRVKAGSETNRLMNDGETFTPSPIVRSRSNVQQQQQPQANSNGRSINRRRQNAAASIRSSPIALTSTNWIQPSSIVSSRSLDYYDYGAAHTRHTYNPNDINAGIGRSRTQSSQTQSPLTRQKGNRRRQYQTTSTTTTSTTPSPNAYALLPNQRLRLNRKYSNHNRNRLQQQQQHHHQTNHDLNRERSEIHNEHIRYRGKQQQQQQQQRTFGRHHNRNRQIEQPIETIVQPVVYSTPTIPKVPITVTSIVTTVRTVPIFHGFRTSYATLTTTTLNTSLIPQSQYETSVNEDGMTKTILSSYTDMIEPNKVTEVLVTTTALEEVKLVPIRFGYSTRTETLTDVKTFTMLTTIVSQRSLEHQLPPPPGSLLLTTVSTYTTTQTLSSTTAVSLLLHGKTLVSTLTFTSLSEATLTKTETLTVPASNGIQPQPIVTMLTLSLTGDNGEITELVTALTVQQPVQSIVHTKVERDVKVTSTSLNDHHHHHQHQHRHKHHRPIISVDSSMKPNVHDSYLSTSFKTVEQFSETHPFFITTIYKGSNTEIYEAPATKVNDNVNFDDQPNIFRKRRLQQYNPNGNVYQEPTRILDLGNTFSNDKKPSNDNGGTTSRKPSFQRIRVKQSKPKAQSIETASSTRINEFNRLVGLPDQSQSFRRVPLSHEQQQQQHYQRNLYSSSTTPIPLPTSSTYLLANNFQKPTFRKIKPPSPQNRRIVSSVRTVNSPIVSSVVYQPASQEQPFASRLVHNTNFMEISKSNPFQPIVAENFGSNRQPSINRNRFNSITVDDQYLTRNRVNEFNDNSYNSYHNIRLKSTIEPTKSVTDISVHTPTIPLTYYTTFTYMTTVIRGQHTAHLSRESVTSTITTKALDKSIVEIVRDNDGMIEPTKVLQLGVKTKGVTTTVYNAVSQVQVYNEDLYNVIQKTYNKAIPFKPWRPTSTYQPIFVTNHIDPTLMDSEPSTTPDVHSSIHIDSASFNRFTPPILSSFGDSSSISSTNIVPTPSIELMAASSTNMRPVRISSSVLIGRKPSNSKYGYLYSRSRVRVRVSKSSDTSPAILSSSEIVSSEMVVPPTPTTQTYQIESTPYINPSTSSRLNRIKTTKSKIIIRSRVNQPVSNLNIFRVSSRLIRPTTTTYDQYPMSSVILSATAPEMSIIFENRYEPNHQLNSHLLSDSIDSVTIPSDIGRGHKVTRVSNGVTLIISSKIASPTRPFTLEPTLVTGAAVLMKHIAPTIDQSIVGDIGGTRSSTEPLSTSSTTTETIHTHRTSTLYSTLTYYATLFNGSQSSITPIEDIKTEYITYPDSFVLTRTIDPLSNQMATTSPTIWPESIMSSFSSQPSYQMSSSIETKPLITTTRSTHTTLTHYITFGTTSLIQSREETTHSLITLYVPSSVMYQMATTKLATEIDGTNVQPSLHSTSTYKYPYVLNSIETSIGNSIGDPHNQHQHQQTSDLVFFTNFILPSNTEAENTIDGAKGPVHVGNSLLNHNQLTIVNVDKPQSTKLVPSMPTELFNDSPTISLVDQQQHSPVNNTQTNGIKPGSIIELSDLLDGANLAGNIGEAIKDIVQILSKGQKPKQPMNGQFNVDGIDRDHSAVQELMPPRDGATVTSLDDPIYIPMNTDMMIPVELSPVSSVQQPSTSVMIQPSSPIYVPAITTIDEHDPNIQTLTTMFFGMNGGGSGASTSPLMVMPTFVLGKSRTNSKTSVHVSSSTIQSISSTKSSIVSSEIDPSSTLSSLQPSSSFVPQSSFDTTRFITSVESNPSTVVLTTTKVYYTRDSPLTITSEYISTMPAKTIITTIAGTNTIVNTYSTSKSSTSISTSKINDLSIKPTVVQTLGLGVTPITAVYSINGNVRINEPSNSKTDNGRTLRPTRKPGVSRFKPSIRPTGGPKPMFKTSHRPRVPYKPSPTPPVETPIDSNVRGTYKKSTKPSLPKTTTRPSILDLDQCKPGCNAANKEICKEINGKFKCDCRPGYTKKSGSVICHELQNFIVLVRATKLGESELVWEPDLQNQSSVSYQNLAKAARTQLDSIQLGEELKDNYIGSDVMSIEQTIDGTGVLVNLTIHLTESGDMDQDLLREKLARTLESKPNMSSSLLPSSDDEQLPSPSRLLADLEDVIDFDECSTDEYNDCASSARCINEPGSYRCECLNGYPDLDLSFPGRMCASEIKACEFCNGHGDCFRDETGQISSCKCHRMYLGRRCDINGLLLAIFIPVLAILCIVSICSIVYCCRKWKNRALTKGFRNFSAYGPNVIGNTLDRKAMLETSSDNSDPLRSHISYEGPGLTSAELTLPREYRRRRESDHSSDRSIGSLQAATTAQYNFSPQFMIPRVRNTVNVGGGGVGGGISGAGNSHYSSSHYGQQRGQHRHNHHNQSHSHVHSHQSHHHHGHHGGSNYDLHGYNEPDHHTHYHQHQGGNQRGHHHSYMWSSS